LLYGPMVPRVVGFPLWTFVSSVVNDLTSQKKQAVPGDGTAWVGEVLRGGG
jgi:hypothetical protein